MSHVRRHGQFGSGTELFRGEARRFKPVIVLYTIYCLAMLMMTGPTPASAATLATGANTVDTLVKPDGTRAYMLGSGTSTISVVDPGTQQVLYAIPLGIAANTAADMDWHTPTARILVGTTTGLILSVNPTTSTVTTVFNNPAANYAVITADNYVTGTLAWAIDLNTGWLTRFFTNGTFAAVAPMPFAAAVELVEKKITPGAPAAQDGYLIAVGNNAPGTASLWAFDRTTLTGFAPAIWFGGPAVTFSGVSTHHAAPYAYVTATQIGGPNSYLLTCDLTTLLFTALATFPNVAVDVATAGPFIHVLLNLPVGSQIDVFDCGNAGAPVPAGTLPTNVTVNAAGGLASSLGAAGTRDDATVVYANQGSGSDIYDTWAEKGNLVDPVAAGVTVSLEPVRTGSLPGIPMVEGVLCSDCPPEETMARGGVATPEGGSFDPGYNAASSGRMLMYSTGEEVYTLPVFNVPGVGLDLEMTLTYRSRLAWDYRYGNGWSLSQDVRLITQPNNDEDYVNGRGRVDRYVWQTGGTYQKPFHYDMSLLVPGGSKSLTNRFGTVSTFNAAGYRTSIADRYGNTIMYNWIADQLVGIVDTLGRSYTLTYDATGRLSSITDFGSRTWTFKYDYLGRLRWMRTPASTQFPTGRVQWFSYAPNSADLRLKDNLVHVGNARNQKEQSLAYDSNDLATRETIGWASYTINYTPAQQMAQVTDRSGNVTQWTFGTAAMPTKIEVFTRGLRAGEPASYVFTQAVTSNGLPQHRVYPRGNRDDYTYDSSLNLTEVRRKMTNTSSTSSTDLVQAWEYLGAYNQVTKYTDPKGNITTYTVDTSGNTTQVNRPTVTNPATQTITETLVWDSRGRIVSATDGAGRLTAFSYYTSGPQTGYLQAIRRDPSGLNITTTFAYDQFGHVTSLTDPRSSTTTLTVDTEGFVTQIQAPSPLSYRTKLTYDADRNVTLTEAENIDRKGVVDPSTPWIDTAYAFDSTSLLESRTVRLTASVTATTHYEYEGSGRLARILHPEGNQETFEYDERGLLFKATRGYGTADASTIQVDYDDNGNRSKVTDGRGFASTYQHDLFDRRERATNSLGHYTTFTWDKNSNVTQIAAYSSASVLMARSNYGFDQVDRMWRVIQDRFGTGLTTTYPTTTITRDAGHLVTEVKDPLNRATTRTHDAAGRLLTLTDAAGNVVTYGSDANGNVTQVSDTQVPTTGSSETFVTQFVYDVLNRRTSTKEIDRLNASNILTTTFEFDSRSNLTFRTDAEGHPARWTYDLASRLTKYERALTVGSQIDTFTTSIDEEFAYDKNHRLTGVTDDNFNATTYVYDALNRLLGTTYADNRTVTNTWDKNGNLSTWTDQNGSVATSTYDQVNRLTARTITRGTGVQGTTAEVFNYDALNRTLVAVDDDYQVELTWDSVGNLLQERQGYATSGQEKWKTVGTAWDDAGSTSRLTYPSGFQVDHSRDGIDRLTALGDVAASVNIAAFTWQGRGRLQQTTNQNGTITEYAYDGFERVQTIDHLNGSGQSYHRFEYAYDKAHNRRMEKNSFHATWVGTLPAAVQGFLNARNGKGDVYAYDWAHRLVDARYDVTNPASEVASPGSQAFVKLVQYGLDGLGNRTQVQVTPPTPPTSTTYASDVMNQYTTVGGVSRAHDLNGNVSDDGTYLWKYDYLNHVTEVINKGTSASIATYRYDPLGRRVEKSLSGGATTRYLLDGQHVVEEYDGGNAWQARYMFEDGWDRPRAMDRADVADVDGDANTAEVLRFHYAQNALGSVSELSQPSGAVVEWTTYDVYGMPTIRDAQGSVVGQSAVGNPFLCTGREWDVESATYFYRARQYDPERGRFLQRDPIGYSRTLELYSYGVAAPTVWVDPTGEDPPPPHDEKKKDSPQEKNAKRPGHQEGVTREEKAEQRGDAKLDFAKARKEYNQQAHETGAGGKSWEEFKEWVSGPDGQRKIEKLLADAKARKRKARSGQPAPVGTGDAPSPVPAPVPPTVPVPIPAPAPAPGTTLPGLRPRPAGPSAQCFGPLSLLFDLLRRDGMTPDEVEEEDNKPFVWFGPMPIGNPGAKGDA